MKISARSSAIFLVILLISLAACGGDDKKSEQTPSPTTTAKPVIRLATNSWVGSELNAAVAKIILEEKLGYPVEIVPMDEYEQWAHIASGEIHANLEVWGSGHTADVQQYIDSEKTIVNGGPLGVQGKIGWYIPGYMLKDHYSKSSGPGWPTTRRTPTSSSASFTTLTSTRSR